MFQTDLLKDKVVLVTGGGTGLGKSMSLRFAELGAKVVIASRKMEHLAQAAQEIEAKGTECLPVTCDVRDYDQVEGVVKQAALRFGKLDVLVNNAAGNFLCPTEDLTPNGFASVIGIVLTGSFHTTLAAGRQMIAQGTGGNILSIVTTYAWTGSAYVVPSVCGKAGVLAMTRSLAVEWARHKIRCNAIAPGPFPTEGAWGALVPGGGGGFAGDAIKKKVPLGRVGEHHELANLAAYLVSDGSGYITGDCVTIDGGEWLGGAGEFNFFTQMDPGAVKQMMGAMRPKK